jgi:hypothetical protein
MASVKKPRLSGAEIDRLVVKHIELRLESLTSRRKELESVREPFHEYMTKESAERVVAHLLATVVAEMLTLQRVLAAIKRARRNIGPTQKWYREGFWGEVEPDAEWEIEDLRVEFGDSAAITLLAAPTLAGIRSNRETYPGSVFAASDAWAAAILGKKEES